MKLSFWVIFKTEFWWYIFYIEYTQYASQKPVILLLGGNIMAKFITEPFRIKMVENIKILSKRNAIRKSKKPNTICSTCAEKMFMLTRWPTPGPMRWVLNSGPHWCAATKPMPVPKAISALLMRWRIFSDMVFIVQFTRAGRRRRSCSRLSFAKASTLLQTCFSTLPGRTWKLPVHVPLTALSLRRQTPSCAPLKGIWML